MAYSFLTFTRPFTAFYAHYTYSDMGESLSFCPQ